VDVPSLPWSALFLILSLVVVGVAGMHAAAPGAQFSDQFAAAVLVPLGLLGVVVWGVAIRMLTLGRRKR
jgi:ABC-type transport system involved in cytochrome c biogenesis permease subunit